MYRRGSHQSHYNPDGSYSPAGQGDYGFWSPMPRFQSSPRMHHHQFISHHTPQSHGGPRSPTMSPIAPPPGDRNRHMSMPSPNTQLYPGRRGNHGSPAWGGYSNTSGNRGRRHYYSGGNSPRDNRDCNPGGSDDISKYFHPSMIEDPWEKLEPVPVTKTIDTTV